MSGLIVIFFGVGLTKLFWVMFLSLFIPCYIVGGSVAWLVHGNRIIAHQTIYRFSFTFSIALVVAFSGTAIGAIVGVVNSRAIDNLGAITGDDYTAIMNATMGAMYLACVVVGAVVGAIIGAIGSAATLVAVITFFTFMVIRLADDKSIITTDFSMGLTTDVVISIVIAIGIAIVVASIAFILLNKLQKYSEHKQLSYLFWLVYTVISLIISFIIIFNINDVATIGLFFFYLILPFVNAPLDWLSLGITRGLLHSIYHEYHSGWQAFAWALFDLVLAVLFLFAVSALLVFTVGMADHMGNQNFLRITLDGLSKPETAKAHYWVHAMLLTTLIPTLVHFAIAGTSLVMWLPQQGRHWMANNLKGNLYKIWPASFYLTFTPIIGLLAPIALLYGLYLLVTAHGGWLGGVLLDWANLLAGVIV